MGNIKITHGIYSNNFYERDGFYNEESRRYLPLPMKFRNLLDKKRAKFSIKYGIEQVRFVVAHDTTTDIKAISICHPAFDNWSDKIGEDIVVGRIKRMNGDVKEIIYEMEEIKTEMKVKEAWDNGVKVEHFKTITRKRVKMDENGEPVIKRTIYFKPYDIHKRYRIKNKDGTMGAGELVYPYIYKLER
jgi:hypothetical protein